MAILIRSTEQKDLPLVQALWSNGDVMQFVGFPNGLVQSDEDMARWHSWIQKNQPHCMHYSIFDGDEYCGETYYEIDRHRTGSPASISSSIPARAAGALPAKR